MKRKLITDGLRRAAPKQAKRVQWLGYLRYTGYAAAVVAAVAVFFAARHYYLIYSKSVFLKPERPCYYHDEVIKLSLFTRDKRLNAKWAQTPPQVRVTLAGKPVKTIGGLAVPYMQYDAKANLWRGIFPCPWNAPRKNYQLELVGENIPPQYLKESGFAVGYRYLPDIPKRFVVLTMEYAGWYGGLKMKAPDGAMVGPDGVAKWAKHLGANVVWVLAGKTTGAGGLAWNTVDYATIQKIGADCHKQGIQFGVWAMCYLTHPQEGKPWLSRYEWAMDIQNGEPVKVRAVSLRDPLRPDDIADFLQKFNTMPEVDYLGLDYIRNALGGYELAEDFYRDMPWIRKPKGWDKMSRAARLTAFAMIKIARKDREFIDAWQWWRAHKVGQIVRRIKSRLGDSKKLWAFTLGWEKGWQHGQDPVMMIDAGVDIDAIMLYEADGEQFASMMKDWSAYISRNDTRVIVGDVIDSPLHQDGGTTEYKKRFAWAMKGIYKDGPAYGIFMHDLCRLLWGRKGVETTDDWARASIETVQTFNSLEKGRQ